MGLILGLLALVGSALFAIGLFVLKVLAVAALITGVVTWFKWLYNKFKVRSKKATTIPVQVLSGLIDDAKKNVDPATRKKYSALEEALMAGCDNYSQDVIGLAQNDSGDVIAATSFGAEDYQHQVDDARDNTIAVDGQGNIIKKIRI